MSACSFSTLRLNLVLTHGIAPDVHGGIHIFIFPTPTTIQSMFKYKILVLLYCCCTGTFCCCHNIQQSRNQPEGCQSCSHDQLAREKFPCPRSRLELWFRETDLAVPSRVSLLILHTQAESGAYSRDCSRCPRQHPYIYFFHTHYDTKYVQIQNISTIILLLYWHVLLLS